MNAPMLGIPALHPQNMDDWDRYEATMGSETGSQIQLTINSLDNETTENCRSRQPVIGRSIGKCKESIDIVYGAPVLAHTVRTGKCCSRVPLGHDVGAYSDFEVYIYIASTYSSDFENRYGNVCIHYWNLLYNIGSFQSLSLSMHRKNRRIPKSLIV